jgi:HAD superfamily phosphoserine phosphatase-like hydrolase
MSPLLVVFDVDGTLIRGDSLLMAARKANNLTGLLIATIRCLPFYVMWKLNLVAPGRLKEIIISSFRICEAVNYANSCGENKWLLDQLLQAIRPEALLRLRQHQANGDRIILCSASPGMLLRPLANSLQVELVCTEMINDVDKWLPILATPNCKGSEKLRRLSAYVGALQDIKLECYGDSLGDRELLNYSDIPHYRSFSDDPVAYRNSAIMFRSRFISFLESGRRLLFG